MPVNKKYIDRSAGIDEYVAETADEALLRGMYQNNLIRMSGMNNYWARIGRAKFDSGNIYDPNKSSSNPINESYNQNLSQLEQWKSEQYGEQQKAYETSVGKLDESLTKSIASGRKSLDEYNKKQREQAKYDISQAYQYYLQQQQAIMGTPTLSEGSKEYLESQVEDTTTTAKAKVEQNLKETLGAAQTQFEENVAEATADVKEQKATLKETYERNLAEIDKTFETNKTSLESMRDSSFSSADYQKDLSTNYKDYGTSVTETNNLFSSYAPNDDIEKGIDKVRENVTKLKSDYEKADALAVEWENKASTAAEKSYAKSLRAIANNAKKLYDEGVKQLNTFVARAYTYESDKIAIKEKIRKEFETSEIYSLLKDEYKDNAKGLQNYLYTSDGELTDAGKEMYATYLFNKQEGFTNPLQKLGLEPEKIKALLGIDEKDYPEQEADYLVNKHDAKNTVEKIPNASYVGYAKYTDDGKSFYVDGNKYDIDSLTKIPDDSLSISEEDIDKIPAGTVFSGTIKSPDKWYDDKTIKEILTEQGLTERNDIERAFGDVFSDIPSDVIYSKNYQYTNEYMNEPEIQKTKAAAQVKKEELEKQGFTVEIIEREAKWDSFKTRSNKMNIILYVTGYNPKSHNYYKSSDGNIYYLN